MSVVNDVDLEGPPTTMEYINAYKVSDDTLESVANRDRDVVTEIIPCMPTTFLLVNIFF